MINSLLTHRLRQQKNVTKREQVLRRRPKRREQDTERSQVAIIYRFKARLGII
jgi:hypothetical protein